MSTGTLSFHVGKRYLDNTSDLLSEVKEAVARVGGLAPTLGDLTVCENNIAAAGKNFEDSYASLEQAKSSVDKQGSDTSRSLELELYNLKSVYARLQQKLRCTTTERDTAIFAVKNANELISGQLSQLKVIQKRLMEKESIIASQESELRSANAQKQEALGDQEKLLKKKLVAQLITKDRQVEQLKLDVKAISAQRDSSTRAASDLQIEMEKRAEEHLAEMERLKMLAKDWVEKLQTTFPGQDAAITGNSVPKPVLSKIRSNIRSSAMSFPSPRIWSPKRVRRRVLLSASLPATRHDHSTGEHVRKTQTPMTSRRDGMENKTTATRSTRRMSAHARESGPEVHQELEEIQDIDAPVRRIRRVASRRGKGRSFAV